MKKTNHNRRGTRHRLAVSAVSALALFGTVIASHATLIFDNVSNFRNGVAGATGTSTGTTPNTFMGDGYTLLSGATSISGFDLFPTNLSGTNYTGLRLTVYVWDTVNTGTVNATTPAFGNLITSFTLTSTGTYTSGFYYAFESATPGVTPGIALATPLPLGDTTIGLTFAYQGTTDGVNYASANNLTSLITYGTPATVGSNIFNGYYRNANSETNGNFTSTLRSLGQTNQSVAVRVYGDAVPEPSTWVMIASATGVLLVLAGRKRLMVRAA